MGQTQNAQSRSLTRRATRVLIADANTTATRTVSSFLRERGYEVTSTSSAQAVLDQPAPDVLIASTNLRDRNVFDLCEEIGRVSASSTWMLVTGAHLREEDYRRAMRVGVRDLLRAPVALEDLLRSIEAAKRSRAQESLSTFRRSYECNPRTFPRILRDLLAFSLRAGLGPTARARIGTACAEVLENSWEHGYAGESGPVCVSANVDAHTLEIEIGDEGSGFDSFSIAAKSLDGPLDTGLARAGSLAEDLALSSTPGEGAQVRLSFAAYRVDFDDEDDSLDLSDWDYLAPEFSRRLSDDVQFSGEPSATNLSPALAVVVGRMLAGPTPMVRAMRALWSA